jgi:GT2 family glycosyltransferase
MATQIKRVQNSSAVEASQIFVTAILVTHNGASWLPEVIAALSSQSRRVDRIIAVDTGSVDSSAKLLRAAGITFIQAERDIGYGDAIELALSQTPAIEKSIDNEWIWLIHDDCAPATDALQLLLDAVVQRPQIVIAGPKLIGWYDRDHLLEAGISIAGNGARWTGLEHREQNQGQHDATIDVLSVSTAAMLVRRTAFEELGGLDPNLALFRDDVDLGWRAHVAGLGAICVGAATAFHAEASATERRAVDVSEAFLHRPLLLDRRNAAYVMLVNTSWWLLPWVGIQVIGTSLIRAVFDLLAKLPGYAADEIAAVGLLILHPADLIKARRLRKKTRLLSPTIIKKFVPGRATQIRAGLDRLAAAFTKKIQKEDEVEPITGQTYSALGIVPEDFDEIDYAPTNHPSIFKRLAKRPDLLISILILVLSVVAGRSRFGSLSGGALGAIPPSGAELLRSYADSWHLVGMGSSMATPPWVAVLGLASIVTLGHLSLLLTTIFFLAPSIAFLTFAWALRKIGIKQYLASIGGLVYVLTPLLWTALNQGRIDVLVLYLIAPIFLFVNPLLSKISEISWRKFFSVALLVGIVASFSPLIFGIWLVIQFIMLINNLVRTRATSVAGGWIDFLEGEAFKPALRRIVLIITVLFLELPWSLGLILHPTQFLFAPGVPTANGGVLHVALNNPGGVGSPPVWIVAPVVIFGLASWAVSALRAIAGWISVVLGGAILLTVFHVDGHGAIEPVWVGVSFLIISIILIPPVLKQAEQIIPTMQGSRLGLTHIAMAVASVMTVLTMIMMVVWIGIGTSQTQAQSDQGNIFPAFVSSLDTTPARPKTLVLAVRGATSTFFISRGAPLSLGDADVATAIPGEIKGAVEQIVTGSGVTSGKILGTYGIQYVFVKSPVPVALARTIDGIGGFSRMSATTSGIVWRVMGAYPRVMLHMKNNKNYLIPSGDIGATGKIPSGGVVYLAEKYDSNWQLLINGSPVPLSTASNGMPIFNIAEAGTVTLLYDGTAHRGLMSLELLTLLIAVVMTLPSGRRKKQVPLDELV